MTQKPFRYAFILFFVIFSFADTRALDFKDLAGKGHESAESVLRNGNSNVVSGLLVSCEANLYQFMKAQRWQALIRMDFPAGTENLSKEGIAERLGFTLIDAESKSVSENPILRTVLGPSTDPKAPETLTVILTAELNLYDAWRISAFPEVISISPSQNIPLQEKP